MGLIGIWRLDKAALAGFRGIPVMHWLDGTGCALGTAYPEEWFLISGITSPPVQESCYAVFGGTHLVWAGRNQEGEFRST